ncbi:MAG: DNA polymerase Y family protein, partial [Acidimicrobiales bacterium]
VGPQAVFTGVLDGGRDPDQEVRLLAWGEPGRLQRPSGEPGRLQRPPAEPGRLQRPPAEPGTARRGSAEIPPWPGQLPAPAPAVVHPPPLRAEVCDQDLAVVEVSGRGVVSSSPSTVSIEGGPAASVVAWAGPWPVDERWWDDKPRRRARFQVVTDTGAAYLFTRASGRWWVEATYD